MNQYLPPNYVGAKKAPAIGGTVTHPDDLQPAIDALSDIGKAWLNRETKGRDVTPRDIAKAADFERGDKK